METINDIVREMRKKADLLSIVGEGDDLFELADRAEAAHKQAIIDAVKTAVATKCEVCMNQVTQAALKAKAAGEGYAAGKQSVTDCNQHETVDLESRCIYGAAKDAEPVGNAAKMREALVKIYNVIRSYCFDYGAGESHESLVDRILDDPPDYTSYRDSILEIDRIVEAALSEPRRNCDVGTAEEQAKRFKNYCNSKVCKRNVCHSHGYEELFHHECFPIWAQMPYEKEGEE